MKNSRTIPAAARPENLRRVKIESRGEDLFFSPELKALLQLDSEESKPTPHDADSPATSATSVIVPFSYD